MSRRPEFLRESMWRLLDDHEKQQLHAAVTAAGELAARLEQAQADVAMHRRLARKFADQARSLLASMRDRPDSHGSPPSVVRRVEQLADDLASTAHSAAPRTRLPDVSSPRGAERAVGAYTPPVVTTPASQAPPVRADTSPGRATTPPPEPPEEMDDEEREATQVGAVQRVRSNVKKEHTLRELRELHQPSIISYDGDLEILDEVEEI